MDIYIDESIHERANFIVLAAVCAKPDDIQAATAALRECGFTPGHDEFKSSIRMNGNPQAQDLRDRFQQIIGRCKIAIGVCAATERDQLMSLAARVGEAMASHDTGKSGTIHLDQGMKRQPINLPSGYLLETDCDSKAVIGIQLADCCAHFIATMLLGELGLFDKMVPANRVYSGDEGEFALAWGLWASLRYALASSQPLDPVDEDSHYEPTRKPFGLVFSDGCDEAVMKAANKRFAVGWIGCIH